MTTDPASLVARWGFQAQDDHYIRHGLCNTWLGPIFGDILIRHEEQGWRVVRPPRPSDESQEPQFLSEAFQEPWQAAQDAAIRGILSTRTNRTITKRQFEMLRKIGLAYYQGWTRVEPWGTLLPWFEGITMKWLEVARMFSNLSSDLPHQRYSLYVPQHPPKRSYHQGEPREDLLEIAAGNVELVVDPLGEVTIDLFQPGAAHRHWHQLQEAVTRCGDLPAAHDLLLAALPPQPDQGKELAAQARVVLGDLELHTITELSVDQVAELRKAIFSTTERDPMPEFDPAKLKLAKRLGEELEARPNYHPDMDLWWDIKTDPEVHFLLWRDQVLGICRGSHDFELNEDRPEGLLEKISKKALRTWIRAMAPGISAGSLANAMDLHMTLTDGSSPL